MLRSMSTPAPQDELTTTALRALKTVSATSKAHFLLETALALINQGQYGAEVENYLEVYLRTPGLTNDELVRALLARAKARRTAGEGLLSKAEQDLLTVSKLDPSNKEIRRFVRSEQLIHFADSPASHRAPPEVWDRIASYIPRFHLRTWLFVSAFHRNIALRIIFHTVDLYFGEDQDNLNRSLDIFDRVKDDKSFANRIKVLRLHWACEQGDMLDLMIRIFRTTLPEFKALRSFEWIGYPEVGKDLVQVLLASHSHLEALGLIGWHFDAEGVSAFSGLRKFTLRAEDDDGWADMGEIRTVLDVNEHTLRHLCLGAYLARDHSWDSAFQSTTIQNLTHLDLVDTRISHIVLARIAHAHNLQSLTLHGTFEEPRSASVVFGSDHLIEGRHTFLPHLQAFRFVLVGHDDEFGLWQNVAQFIKHRRKLRRLDLGNCPWELVSEVLPGLVGLRVLRVRIANLTQVVVQNLVQRLPKEMVAIHLATVACDQTLDHYASLFAPFHTLSLLHLHKANKKRPQLSHMSEKEYHVQSQLWHTCLQQIAVSVPSLDFVGWHGEHWVIVRGTSAGEKSEESEICKNVELKELPARKRLDCGTGVDLGSEDAAWLERKDVPMDYEMPGLEA
ncbi:hypothetical protein PUNSTDRAFT_92032 [Punctularia strigosozonata HHB-11173 SS5]|uniref:F-box domain-containing protein n=1 Tax=Punctularia strigosozonata (strain HHB-11173) TaxID=741275 RepID=R7S5E9_PUNST|nr:uncharacterized protein PUNSTDRAFT_92032 [Punctularia strigosozonata HHB-11173 SS5]EIN05157.1 hypothetical protein PUNSTDRAFT_92032 [Punctularia strigosozonata HHB-11173 SS5]